MNEATARLKINRLLENADWRFFPEGNSPANVQLEAGVALKPLDVDGLGDDFERRAETAQFVRENGAEGVHGGFVAGGRFELDEALQVGEHVGLVVAQESEDAGVVGWHEQRSPCALAWVGV